MHWQGDHRYIQEWMPKLVAVYSVPDVPTLIDRATYHTVVELGASLRNISISDEHDGSSAENNEFQRCVPYVYHEGTTPQTAANPPGRYHSAWSSLIFIYMYVLHTLVAI